MKTPNGTLPPGLSRFQLADLAAQLLRTAADAERCDKCSGTGPLKEVTFDGSFRCSGCRGGLRPAPTTGIATTHAN